MCAELIAIDIGKSNRSVELASEGIMRTHVQRREPSDSVAEQPANESRRDASPSRVGGYIEAPDPADVLILGERITV
jgi:hypothetical protein